MFSWQLLTAKYHGLLVAVNFSWGAQSTFISISYDLVGVITVIGKGKSTGNEQAFRNTQQVKLILKLGVETTLSFHGLCLSHFPLPFSQVFFETVF